MNKKIFLFFNLLLHQLVNAERPHHLEETPVGSWGRFYFYVANQIIGSFFSIV